MASNRKIKITPDTASPYVLCQIFKLSARVAALESLVDWDGRKKIRELAKENFDRRLKGIEKTNPKLAARIRAWDEKRGGLPVKHVRIFDP